MKNKETNLTEPNMYVTLVWLKNTVILINSSFFLSLGFSAAKHSTKKKKEKKTEIIMISRKYDIHIY